KDLLIDGALCRQARELQGEINGHALATLFGNQCHSLIAHIDDWFERLVEVTLVALLVNRVDEGMGGCIQRSILLRRAGQPLLDGDAALGLELDLDVAQSSVNVFAHAYLAALAPDAMMVKITRPGGIIEIAGLVSKVAPPFDLQAVEVGGWLGHGLRGCGC